MKIFLLTLIFLISMHTHASDDFGVIIFSKRLDLKGDCKFSPSKPIVPRFVCMRNERLYTVSFINLFENETAHSKIFTSADVAKKWQVTVTSQVTGNADGLIHLSEMGFSNDGSIRFHQYSLCDEQICVSFNSESKSVYSDIVLQITSNFIDTKMKPPYN